MLFPELGRVARRHRSPEQHAHAAARTGGWHRIHDARLCPDVTAHAALAGVARYAGRAGALRILAMRADKVGGSVTRRRRQRRRVGRRPIVHRERANHRRLGRVDMAGDAEVLCVARRATRRDRERPGGG